MKIGMIGLSHLGLIFTAGFAKLGYEIVAVDQDAAAIAKEISNDTLRVIEVGLTDLLKSGVSENRICFTSNFSLLGDCQIAILSLDTPLDDSENLNLEPVFQLVDLAIPYLATEALFLISSQIVVGTCDLIQEKINQQKPEDNIEVVYFPENLRVGQAIEYFFRADRFIIGAKTQKAYEKISQLLNKIEAPKIHMDIKSAEISKHALNTFLALQVSFINEIAEICDACGADITKVAEALKSDSRIGPRAYFNAGIGITSPPIIREIKTIMRLARENNLNLAVVNGILETNRKQQKKIVEMLKTALGTPLTGKRVGVFGLSYKEGTGFTGKSAAPFIVGELESSGIHCQIYQPIILETQHYNSTDSPYSTSRGCNALLFLNPEKEFLDLDFDKIKDLMLEPKIIFDARNFLPKSDLETKGFLYLAIGRGRRKS